MGKAYESGTSWSKECPSCKTIFKTPTKGELTQHFGYYKNALDGLACYCRVCNKLRDASRIRSRRTYKDLFENKICLANYETEVEKETVDVLLQGKRPTDIAKILGLRKNVVTNRLTWIYRKYAVSSALELVVLLQERPYRRLKVKKRNQDNLLEQWTSELTSRERVVKDLAPGKTNKEIAQILNISEKGVKHHFGNIFRKLNVRGRHELNDMAFHASQADYDKVRKDTDVLPGRPLEL